MSANPKTKQVLISLQVHLQQQARSPLPEELISDSSLLRLVWSTYFEPSLATPLAEKLDHFAQIAIPLLAHSRCREGSPPHQENENSCRSSENDLKRLSAENKELKSQLMEQRQKKNSCEERIIELSNKLYEIERGLASTLECEFSQQEEGNTTLDQFSAISIDRYDERERSRGPLFSKKASLNLDLNDCDARSEENNEIDELAELNLHFPPRSRHPLKQSLQVYSSLPSEHEHEGYGQFIEEMKRMKLQTERMMKMENDRLCLKENKRRTFGGLAQRPSPSQAIHPDKENRRFRRIRA